ncbi:metallophosphoesterase [Georgenia halophila]|uniref:Metallophosphoesterase n=1 Tax=Georgenia halophila TaxID=620889 RepID=A0ABP8LBI6_9MICO
MTAEPSVPDGADGGVVRILHLSDTHFLTVGRHNGVVDTIAATERVLDACEQLAPPHLVVVSGDVSDDGSPDSYELARSVVGSWGKEAGAPVVFSMGNHDARGPFRSVLGTGHLDVDGGLPPVPDPAPGVPVDALSWVGGLRVVTLDTSVPGAGRGELDGAQLSWLAGVLAEPAPDGTVLVLHHPPLRPATRLHEALRLRRPQELAEVVGGTDVRVMLSGHYHHAMTGVVAGVPAVVTPGVANRTETLVRYGTERSVRGSAATLVELGPGSDLTVTPQVVSHPQDGDPVVHLDAYAVDAFVRAESSSPAD